MQHSIKDYYSKSLKHQFKQLNLTYMPPHRSNHCRCCFSFLILYKVQRVRLFAVPE